MSIDPWIAYRASMKKHIEKNDPDELLSWSTVRGTMYVGNGEQILSEYIRLPQDMLRLAEIEEGRPELGGDFFPGTRVDTNLLHQIFHLTKLPDLHEIANMGVIVEVGGGVGSMALAVRRLGFQGAYFIVDFEEMHHIQKLYLGHHLSEKQLEMTGYYTPQEFKEFQPDPIDLLIGIASIGEMPTEDRGIYLEGADRYLLFVFEQYNGINNTNYFGPWLARMERTGFSTNVERYHFYKNCWYYTLQKRERMGNRGKA